MAIGDSICDAACAALLHGRRLGCSLDDGALDRKCFDKNNRILNLCNSYGHASTAAISHKGTRRSFADLSQLQTDSRR